MRRLFPEHGRSVSMTDFDAVDFLCARTLAAAAEVS
jgi:hypothetical protein